MISSLLVWKTHFSYKHTRTHTHTHTHTHAHIHTRTHTHIHTHEHTHTHTHEKKRCEVLEITEVGHWCPHFVLQNARFRNTFSTFFLFFSFFSNRLCMAFCSVVVKDSYVRETNPNYRCCFLSMSAQRLWSWWRWHTHSPFSTSNSLWSHRCFEPRRYDRPMLSCCMPFPLVSSWGKATTWSVLTSPHLHPPRAHARVCGGVCMCVCVLTCVHCPHLRRQSGRRRTETKTKYQNYWRRNGERRIGMIVPIVEPFNFNYSPPSPSIDTNTRYNTQRPEGCCFYVGSLTCRYSWKWGCR